MGFSTIDLSKIAYNFDYLKSRAKTAKIYCVVKSNAYGLGLIDVVKKLDCVGADGFIVADLSEAIKLRENGINKPIIILGYTHPNLAEKLAEFDLTQSVFNIDYLFLLKCAAKKISKDIKVWLKVNTGFNRLGFLSKNTAVLKAALSFNNIVVKGIFAHLSDSAAATARTKKINKKQIKDFEQLINSKIISEKKHEENIDISLFNSGGITKDYRLYDIIRAGAALYGIGSVKDVKPALSVYACVMQINRLNKGESVGYDGAFKTKKNCKIAVLDIGYADGLNRILSKKARVYLNGSYAKIVGNICMNHCFIKLNKNQWAKIGDKAEILGEHIKVKEMAHLSKTIDYEIYCRFNTLPKNYLN